MNFEDDGCFPTPAEIAAHDAALEVYEFEQRKARLRHAIGAAIRAAVARGGNCVDFVLQPDDEEAFEALRRELLAKSYEVTLFKAPPRLVVLAWP